MFKWLSFFIKPFQRKAYADRRDKLLSAFHKNAPDSAEKVLAGLELLTTPTELDGACPVLSLSGKLELRTANFNILVRRMEHSLGEYNRLCNQRKIQWVPLSADIAKEKDKFEGRWLDNYFQTAEPDKVTADLNYMKEMVIVLNNLLNTKERDSFELDDILYGQTVYILRELNTIVEHYLS
ncbi:MAG: hypothetical protein ACRDBQ_18170 [Shewanella sp.]